jgi:hypothetical protein
MYSCIEGIFLQNNVCAPTETYHPDRLFSGLNYLVKVDEEGKLRWARNNELVDTTAGHWKDSTNGGGIIPQDIPERPSTRHRQSFASSTSSSSSSSSSSDAEAAAMHYTGNQRENRLVQWYKRHFTLRGVSDRLLRKTVKRNTWIYVSVSLLYANRIR